MYPDPDPGGQKTYRSLESGSATLTKGIQGAVLYKLGRQCDQLQCVHILSLQKRGGHYAHSAAKKIYTGVRHKNEEILMF